jgi:hypothetical protein
MDAAIALFQGKSYQAYSLLTHIYEHVPPKNGGLLSEDLDKNDKEAMKKAKGKPFVIIIQICPRTKERGWNGSYCVRKLRRS